MDRFGLDIAKELARELDCEVRSYERHGRYGGIVIVRGMGDGARFFAAESSSGESSSGESSAGDYSAGESSSDSSDDESSSDEEAAPARSLRCDESSVKRWRRRRGSPRAKRRRTRRRWRWGGSS